VPAQRLGPLPARKEHMNIHRAVAVSVLIASALACQTFTKPLTPPTPTVAQTPILNSGLSHFENDWIAFDHPAGLTVYDAGFTAVIWYPHIDFGGELVAGLGDERFFGFGNYYRSIRIVRRVLPPASDLARIMADVYAQSGVKYPWPLVNGALDLNGPITIDGRDAIQKSYRIYSGEPAYELRDIWIPIKDEVYIVCIITEWTNPEDLAAFEALADDLLDSLDIKGE